jgi:hypothetical protein
MIAREPWKGKIKKGGKKSIIDVDKRYYRYSSFDHSETDETAATPHLQGRYKNI